MSDKDQSYVRTVTAYVGADRQLFMTQSAARISILKSNLAADYDKAMEDDRKYCDNVPAFAEVLEAFCEHTELFTKMLALAADINAGKES